MPANIANRPLWTRGFSALKRHPARCYARRPQASREERLESVERHVEPAAEDLWHDVSARLRDALNDTTYSTWFGEVEGAELSDAAFVIAVPNDFTREWIEGH